KAIPKDSGMEIVSCSVGQSSQQCLSVSTDGSTNLNWMILFIITTLFILSSIFLYCRSRRRTDTSHQSCDASTLTDGYELMTNREIDELLATRLNNPIFHLTIERDIMVTNNYHLRGIYKSAGAKYDGDLKRLQFLAGFDLRPIIFGHPEWTATPEFVYREALFLTLKKMSEIEELF
ncbi:MAG: hypothetical protein ACKPKO_38705, partial [Candidatus Fonsibacter sp.]